MNTIQGLRSELKHLDKELQTSFLNDKRAAYQDLADLLIAEGRIVEAQDELQMFKEQELHNSLQRFEQKDPRTTRIALTGLESKRFARYYAPQDQQISLGKEREQLQQNQKLGSITPAEQRRLDEINDKILPVLRDAMRVFQKELQKELDKYANDKAYRNSDIEIARVTTNLQNMLASVRKSDPNAKVAALQYVVTDSRLSILLSTPDAPPLARQIEYDGKALRKQILTVRERLSNSKSDPAILKKQFTELYTQLIAPIANDLKTTGSTTLILVPNDVLRYVPFAALYDGERYLVQDYALTLFNEAVKKDKKDFSKLVDATWQLATMGLTRAIEDPKLPALPSVRDELNVITTKTGWEGTIYLDNDFTHTSLISVLNQSFNVLHIASHFEFVAGKPAASRLFLGDRSSLYLSNIASEQMHFDHFALVTFSACESSLGGGLDADGSEMESLGALVQIQGA